MSAQSQLLGLYPLGTGNNITVALNSSKLLPPYAGINPQTVYNNVSALPFDYLTIAHSISSPELDFIFFPNTQLACPSASATASQQTTDLHAKYNSLITTTGQQLDAMGLSAQTYFNVPQHTLDTIGLVYDEMKSYLNYYGYFYPGMTQTLFNQVFIAANLNFVTLYPTDKYTRLLADGSARKIVAGFDDVVNGSSGASKFTLLAGHDTGIVQHMLLLNFTSIDCVAQWTTTGVQPPDCQEIPDFASSFVYELSRVGSQYFVKAMYNGKAFPFCQQPIDKVYCKYEDFKATITSQLFYLDSDKQAYCGNTYLKNYSDNTADNTTLVKLLIGCAILIAILVVALIFLKVWENKLSEEPKQANSVRDDEEN